MHTWFLVIVCDYAARLYIYTGLRLKSEREFYQRDGQPRSEVAADSVEKNPWCQGHHSFLVRHA